MVSACLSTNAIASKHLASFIAVTSLNECLILLTLRIDTRGAHGHGSAADDQLDRTEFFRTYISIAKKAIATRAFSDCI